MKHPVPRHLLPDPPSSSPEEYEATCYRLLEDILPTEMLDESSGVGLEVEENREDILLQGHNQGGGRRETTPGKLDK